MMKLKLPFWNISRIFQRQSMGNSSTVGLFGNLLLTNPRGLYYLTDAVEEKAVALAKEIIRRNKNEFSAISKNRTTTVSLVDDLSNEICCAADLSDCIRNMHWDPNYSKAAEDSMRKFTVLVETLNTMPELYESLKTSLKMEKDILDEVSIRTAKLLLEDFEHSGVHLKKHERQKFVKLSDHIFKSGSNFVNGVDASSQLTDEEAKKLGFTFNELLGPRGSSSDYLLRKSTFSKYFQHNETQEGHLYNLIKYRTELAKLTGFATFAHRAQLHSILLNYDNVLSFLNGIVKIAVPLLEQEVENIRQILSENSKNFNVCVDSVGEWDLEYATAIQKRNIFIEVGENVLNNYLYLDSVLNGFEIVVNQLYGLEFQVLAPEDGEIWAGNVIKLNVYQNRTNFLGTIYLDVDMRSTKVQGDCHFTVRCSKLLNNDTFQTPIVVISLSIVPPEFQNQNISPLKVFETAKLSIQQAENLFHEMGHAIHSMLGRTRFQHVAGTRCPTDFAEVPSHLMECFFNDSRVIRQIFKDKSGRLMSKDESEAIVLSRHIFQNINLLQQTLYAIFDLSLHGDYACDFVNKKISSTDLFENLSNVTLPGMGKIRNYAYHHRISHLVTYGAKYYSYLVAKSAAQSIYDMIMRKDPFSRKAGLKWATIQSHGGEYPSHYLLEKILGHAPDAQELTFGLVTQKI